MKEEKGKAPEGAENMDGWTIYLVHHMVAKLTEWISEMETEKTRLKKEKGIKGACKRFAAWAITPSYINNFSWWAIWLILLIQAIGMFIR